MRERIPLIQDEDQIEVYDNKRKQYAKWSDWMPDTWVFTDLDEAMSTDLPLPLVSKADVGASSRNVRVIQSRSELEAHIKQVFTTGIKVTHCSYPEELYTVQKNYLLFQRFIPHTITYRVNAVGDARAIFYRYCYPDRPMAQTGNVEPAFVLGDKDCSLLEYANRIFSTLQTDWCALDILEDAGNWKLLETSLCWPWPSPGDCNAGMFFSSTTYKPLHRYWIEMFDVLLDQLITRKLQW